MTITLGSVGSGYNLSTMNTNFDLIQAFLNDNVIKREVDDESEANEMRTHLDMNNNKIVNLPYAVYNHEPITLAQLQDIEGGVVVPGVNVQLDPTGTQFVSEDAQAWLEEMDEVLGDFVKIESGSEGTDPNPPSGTVIQAFEIWLIASNEGEKARPLPVDPADGTEVTIRDHGGFCSTYTATIGRNGKTIMGLEEDLTVEVDWSWVRLKYYSVDGDWKVIGGGVGAQVRILPTDVLSEIYPVGSVVVSRNANNPADYWGIGVWERAASGTLLAGIGTHIDSNGVSKTIVSGDNAGEWEHTQTEAELAEHFHHTGWGGGTNADETDYPYGAVQLPDQWVGENDRGGGNNTMPNTNTVGEGKPMNITNPMDGFYVWERVS